MNINMVPLEITAQTQGGVAVHPVFRIGFDGLLAGVLRNQTGSEPSGEQYERPSVLDGGLSLSKPAECALPLAKCKTAGKQNWHWASTTGYPIDFFGETLSPDNITTNITHLYQKLDERRLETTSVFVPQRVGGSKGRFRGRSTPVYTIVCAGWRWRALGNLDQVTNLVSEIQAIGGRRGSGYGAVVDWEVKQVRVAQKDRQSWVHSQPNGFAGRPLPKLCVETFNLEYEGVGLAGLQPPLFHPPSQTPLCLPPSI